MGNPYDIADDDPEYLALHERFGTRPVQAPQKDVGGAIAAGKQAIGSTLKGFGQFGADWVPGVGQDNALKRYGAEVEAANPTRVHGFGDFAESPITGLKEIAGQALGPMGLAAGISAVGTGIGMIPNPVAQVVGRGLQALGPLAVYGAPSQSGIYESQKEQDPEFADSLGGKLLRTGAAATVGQIERSFGPQKLGEMVLSKEGRAAAAKMFAAKEGEGFAKTLGRGMLRTGLEEGGEELMQNPIEQAAGLTNPLSAKNLQDTAWGAASGFMGGGMFGAAGGVHGHLTRPSGEKPLTEDRPTNLLSPNMPEGPAGTQGTLFDREEYLNPNAPTPELGGQEADPVAEYQARLAELQADRNELIAYRNYFQDSTDPADLERRAHALELQNRIEAQMEKLASLYFGENDSGTDSPGTRGTTPGAMPAQDPNQGTLDLFGAPQMRESTAARLAANRQRLDARREAGVFPAEFGFGNDGYGMGNVESQGERIGAGWQHDLLRRRTPEQQAQYDALDRGQSFDLPGMEPAPKQVAPNLNVAQREFDRVVGRQKWGADLSKEEERIFSEYERLRSQIEAKRKLINPLSRAEQQLLETYEDALYDINKVPENERTDEDRATIAAHAKLVNKRETHPSRNERLSKEELRVLTEYEKRVKPKVEAAQRGDAYSRMVIARGVPMGPPRPQREVVSEEGWQTPPGVRSYEDVMRAPTPYTKVADATPSAGVESFYEPAVSPDQLELPNVEPVPVPPSYEAGTLDPWAGVNRTEEMIAQLLAKPKMAAATRENVERAIRTAYAEDQLKENADEDTARYEALKNGKGALASAIAALPKGKLVHIETEVERMAMQAVTAQRVLDELTVGEHRKLNEKGVKARKAALVSLAAAEKYFAEMDALHAALAKPVMQKAELLTMLKKQNVSAAAVAIELLKSIQKNRRDRDGSGVAMHVKRLQIDEAALEEHHEQLLQQLAEKIEKNGGNIAMRVADLHALGIDISRLKVKEASHRIKPTGELVPQFRRLIWAGAKEGSAGTGPDNSVPMYIPIMETYKTKEGDKAGKYNEYGQYDKEGEGKNLHDPANPYKQRIKMGPATTKANGGNEPGVLHITGVRDKPKEARASAAKMAPEEGEVEAMKNLANILRTPGAGAEMMAIVRMAMRKVAYKSIAKQLGVSEATVTNRIQSLRLSSARLKQLGIDAGFLDETVNFAEFLGDADQDSDSDTRGELQGFQTHDSLAGLGGVDRPKDAATSFIERGGKGKLTENELLNLLSQKEQARLNIEGETRKKRAEKSEADFAQYISESAEEDGDLPKSYVEYGDLIAGAEVFADAEETRIKMDRAAEIADWKEKKAAWKADPTLATLDEQGELEKEHKDRLAWLKKQEAEVAQLKANNVAARERFEASKVVARRILNVDTAKAALKKEKVRAAAAVETEKVIDARKAKEAALTKANAMAAEHKIAESQVNQYVVMFQLGLDGAALREMTAEATTLWRANESERIKGSAQAFPIDWAQLGTENRAATIIAVSDYYRTLESIKPLRTSNPTMYKSRSGELFNQLKTDFEDIRNGHLNGENVARVATEAAGTLSEEASGTAAVNGNGYSYARRWAGKGFSDLESATRGEWGEWDGWGGPERRKNLDAFDELTTPLSADEVDRLDKYPISDSAIGMVWRSLQEEESRNEKLAADASFVKRKASTYKPPTHSEMVARLFRILDEMHAGYEQGSAIADAFERASPEIVEESKARAVEEKRVARAVRAPALAAEAVATSKKRTEAKLTPQQKYEKDLAKYKKDLIAWKRRVGTAEQLAIDRGAKKDALIKRRITLGRNGAAQTTLDKITARIEALDAEAAANYAKYNEPAPVAPKDPAATEAPVETSHKETREELASKLKKIGDEIAAIGKAVAQQKGMRRTAEQSDRLKKLKAESVRLTAKLVPEKAPPAKKAHVKTVAKDVVAETANAVWTPAMLEEALALEIERFEALPRAEGDNAAILPGDTVYFGNPKPGDTPDAVQQATVTEVNGDKVTVQYKDPDANGGLWHKGVVLPLNVLRVDPEHKYIPNFSQSEQNGAGQDAKTMGDTLRKLFFSPARFDKLVTIIQSKNQLTPAQYADLLTGAADPDKVMAVHRNGHIYMFADNIAPGNELAVFLHEIGVHLGMVNLLGKAKYDQLTAQIEQWAKGSGKLENTLAKLALARAKSVGEGQKKSEFVAYFVEEAVLHGANPTAVAMMREGPLKSWLRTVVAAMKSALRRLGFRNTDKLTTQNIVDMAYGAATLELTDSTEKAPLSNGSRDFSTASAVMQRVTDLFPNSRLNSSAWTNVKDMAHKFTPMWFTNTQLVERFGKKLTKLGEYVRLQQMADSTRQQIQADTQKVMVKWNALDKKTEAALAKLMLDATTLQAHPDKAFTDPANAHLKPENKAAHADLVAEWNALPQAAKDTYHEARKVLDDRWKQRNEAYHGTVNNMYDPLIAKESDPKVKSRLIRKRDKAHDKYNKLMESFKGPYFPMMRIGSYVVVGMSPKYAALKNSQENATGDNLEAIQNQIDELTSDPRHYSVSSYETAGEAEHAEKTLKTAEGFETRRLKREDFYASLSPMTTHGFADLGSAIDESGFDAKTASKIKAMMTDLFISALPENSALSREAKRRNVHGVKAHEMQRTFAISGERDAFYISRLKHSTKMNDALVELQKQAKDEDNKSSAGFKYEHLHEEMKARMALDMTFNDNPIQNALSTLSWAYHLGVSPAFVFINSTQPWLVTGPVLAGRFGLKPATDALTKAAADSFKVLKAARTDKSKPFGERMTQALDLSGLTKMEQAMTENLIRRRILDIGMEHDLSTEAQGTNPALAKVQKVMGWATQQVELTNRLTTSLASYRLAIGKGMTHNEAVEYAYDTTSQTQFDYNAGNTARVMREGGPVPMAKLIFQFRRYQQSMLYLIGKNFDAAFRGTGPDKEHARATLKYLFASQGLVAGTLGMPMAGVALALAGLGGDDDDEAGSPEVRWRNMLTKMVGKDAAMVLTDGIPTMFGVNLSKRLGMGDVASPFPMAKFSGAQGNSKNTVGQALVNVAGAPANMAVGLLDAKQFFESGQWDKGVEKLAQFAGKWPSDVLRAHRFSTAGMTDRHGRVIVPAEDFTGTDIMLRAAGFAPTRESTYYLANNAKMDVTAAIKERRTALIERLALQVERGESISSLVRSDAVTEFNAKHSRQGALGRVTAADVLKKVNEDKKIPRQRDASGVRFTKAERDFKGLTEFAR